MIKENYLGMVRKIGLTMAAVLLSVVASAQTLSDSTITLFDDLKVPLVEKKYVANTNFQDNWYLSLYGGVTSNFGSDCSHAGYFRLMGPAAMLAVGKEITPVSAVRFQINYVRNTGVTDNQFGSVKDAEGNGISQEALNRLFECYQSQVDLFKSDPTYALWPLSIVTDGLISGVASIRELKTNETLKKAIQFNPAEGQYS